MDNIMVQDIRQREEKMQEVAKNMSRKDFVKDICSRRPINLYKIDGNISRCDNTIRKPNIIDYNKYVKDNVDPSEYTIEYTRGKNFLDTVTTLYQYAPTPMLLNFGDNENSKYGDIMANVKNIYLGINITIGSENVFYSLGVKENSVNIVNSVMVIYKSENIYFSNGIIESYNVFYSKNIYNSSNVWFSINLQGCHECIFCNGLENQSYCIKNQQYEKEEYFKLKQKLLSQKNEYIKWYNSLIHNAKTDSSHEAKNNFIVKSNNITNGYFVYNVNNAKNTVMIGSNETGHNMYNLLLGGAGGCTDIFSVQGLGLSSNIYNSIEIGRSTNIYYSYYLQHCSYCLGCIGLKNKSFCILNKQYSKEEWFEKANEIFAQMEKDGQLGKFFPASMNPFYFNDTVAYLIDDSFTKEEVTKEGFLRRDEAIKVDIPEGMDIVKVSELNNYQGFDENREWKIDPEILKKVIVDEKGNSYRIVKMEYDFLMKYGLPLPELHWLDRIKLGFQFK